MGSRGRAWPWPRRPAWRGVADGSACPGRAGRGPSGWRSRPWRSARVGPWPDGRLRWTAWPTARRTPARRRGPIGLADGERLRLAGAGSATSRKRSWAVCLTVSTRFFAVLAGDLDDDVAGRPGCDTSASATPLPLTRWSMMPRASSRLAAVGFWPLSVRGLQRDPGAALRGRGPAWASTRRRAPRRRTARPRPGRTRSVGARDGPSSRHCYSLLIGRGAPSVVAGRWCLRCAGRRSGRRRSPAARRRRRAGSSPRSGRVEHLHDGLAGHLDRWCPGRARAGPCRRPTETTVPKMPEPSITSVPTAERRLRRARSC